MEIARIVESLHPLERRILQFLTPVTTFTAVSEQSGMKGVEVMRALQWLENKNVLRLKAQAREILLLDENGKKYLKEGLPERKLLESVMEKPLSISKVREKAALDGPEFSIALGVLKSKAAVSIEAGLISIMQNGRKLVDKQSLEELLLRRLSSGGVLLSDLRDEERFAFEELKARKRIVRIISDKEWAIELTDIGEALIKHKPASDDSLERLTPDLIKSGAWKGRSFRRYDLQANVPKRQGGRKHPYNEFINEVKQVLLRMGFVEMTGPIIETEFWNFDALFQPQNHPARTWSATYRIKDPKHGELPGKRVVEAVRAAHENGGDTGSTGWGYKWNPQVAMQLMPRAHDTAISPRYMSAGIKIPGKYFSLVRCFRPDVIDATHGVEFNQMGGIVVGEELSFKHLLGLLRDTAFELTGATEARFFPDYFPFTEPSVQISVKHPKFGWLELAGAGVFRPELCIPLGVKEPVIAWGFGLDRLAMLKLGIKDIRDLFSHDLGFLRCARRYR